MFADYESNMSRVKAILQEGGGFGAEQFAALGAEAQRLGAATKFSAGQAAAAMAVLAQAGFSADQILTATGEVLNLAAAGNLELAEAADIAASAMAGFGVPASELGGLIDVLAKAATSVNTDVRMLGEGFKFVAPVARAFNMSLEETVAAMSLLSDAGIKGEMAGTSLRGMLVAMTAPTKEAQAAFDLLGLKVADQAGNFRGLAPIIEDLRKSLAGRGNVDAAKILSDIFPARPLTGVQALLGGNAKFTMAGLTRTLGQAGGTGARVAATQMDNLAGSVETLLSNLEGLAIVVGQAITPVLREWAAMIGGVVGAVADWAQANPALFQGLTRIAMAAVLGGGAMVALGAALKVVGVAVSGFALVLGPVWLVYMNKTFFVVRQVASVLGVLAGMSEAGRSAMAALGSVMGAVWASVATVAGAAWESVRDTAAEAWGSIAVSLRDGDIESAVAVAGAAIDLEMTKVTVALKNIWMDWFDWFADQWKRASKAVTSAVGEYIPEMSGVTSGLKAVLGYLWEPIQKVKAGPQANENRVKELLEAARGGDMAAAGLIVGSMGDAEDLMALQESLSKRWAALLKDEQAGGLPTAERGGISAINKLIDQALEERDPGGAERRRRARERAEAGDNAIIDAGLRMEQAQAAAEAKAAARKAAAEEAARLKKVEAGQLGSINDVNKALLGTDPLLAAEAAGLLGLDVAQFAKAAAAAAAAKTPEPTAVAGEVAGTFNALVSGLLGPKNVAQKQLQVAEQQLDVQKDMRRALENGGGRFG